MGAARRRAAWAITHCRSAEMGEHLHACGKCHTREFHFHSCNHRSCPQCGKDATAGWVEREPGKRVGAPYFMVPFTLPEELRPLFFTRQAKDIYQLFFSVASSALSDTLANPKWLGRYVCRTAIGDSRILSVSDTHVSFRWKDRARAPPPLRKRSRA